MKLSEVVDFRKDLLFNGAVQISWLETDPQMATKAAKHYVFHGPDYHGVTEEGFGIGEHKLIDTASFTLDLLERISGEIIDEPFTLAIAGYGTGKSHLGVTIASLLSNPGSTVAQDIVNNITRADGKISNKVKNILNRIKQPYLVIAINGMKDFDLQGEIIRQIFQALNKNHLDTSVLESLRPRFKFSLNFVESFYTSLKDDFIKFFGPSITLQAIIDSLKFQDEEAFSKVSKIYEEKMGSPIRAVGQESLDDFIRVVKETYCGEDKPFAGILIIFDEFGRYMEFSVRKPHIAGSGALQQLFECVQANSDGVFLLCFIQYELKAYISRVAPELRDDLNRYVTRYDSVQKVRLSTNLETLIANLLEKKDKRALEQQVKEAYGSIDSIHSKMKKWFPDFRNYAVWIDPVQFEHIICEGCWPFHPLATWALCKLSSIGKTLQQRSAFSLSADVYQDVQNKDVATVKSITAVNLCIDALIDEFLASEKYGQQGATAHAYEHVIQKYIYEVSEVEKGVLKAILLSSKIGIKTSSREEYQIALAMLTGLEGKTIEQAVHLLESEYGVLEWNDLHHQFEIVGDAVPKRTFLDHLASKVEQIPLQERALIFSSNYAQWFEKEVLPTDFAAEVISTKEWNYSISFSDISLLESNIDFAFKTWKVARGVDENKGQLIYCYVGPDSEIDTIKDKSQELIRRKIEENKVNLEYGAPLTVVFLHDNDGLFGEKVAEYWVLMNGLSAEEKKKFSNFILDRTNSVKQELDNMFFELEKARHVVFAINKPIQPSRIKNMLTELFKYIYPKYIPFPFDGFTTTRGNAAKDCQLFTRQLILGLLDRDWISGLGQAQANRAYAVLDRSWGIFDDDGSVRIKPVNKAVREVIELLESYLDGTDDNNEHKKVNLGEIIRVLCAPPYGCNIASAGMILALFIGRRKKNLNILRNGQVVGMENWVQEALPKNFFVLSVLNDSELVLISDKTLSEWEILLDDWDAETTFDGIISYLSKAKKLEERCPVHQNLFYKYEIMKKEAMEASKKLKAHENELDSILERIEKAKEIGDAGKLSWGAADLFALKEKMGNAIEQWTRKQIKEIESNFNEALQLTLKYFPEWLNKQKVTNVMHLEKFRHTMVNLVGENLKKLNLERERAQLVKHVEEIKQNVRFLAEIKEITSKIDDLVTTKAINNNMPISVINSLLKQVGDYECLLKEAGKRTNITEAEILKAEQRLEKYETQAKNQIAEYQERVAAVLNINKIQSMSDIELLRSEVVSLIRIYEGQEQDIEDLKMVLRQLDLIQDHFKRLNDNDLAEEELEITLKKSIEEVYKEFADDVPPLDTELIYSSLIKAVRESRALMAADWIKHNLPDSADLKQVSLQELMEIKQRLANKPRFLSIEQTHKVKEIIKICDKQLDEHEIEGLLVRIKNMNRDKRRIFIQRLLKMIKEEDLLNGVKIS